MWIGVEAWLFLFYCDFLMHLRGFRIASALQTPRAQVSGTSRQCACFCRAIDFACVFYFKPIRCLQRSTATTMLLRKHGLRADLVIGASLMPFQSHAWVEVDGHVVNDKPYINEVFSELARY